MRRSTRHRHLPITYAAAAVIAAATVTACAAQVPHAARSVARNPGITATGGTTWPGYHLGTVDFRSPSSGYGEFLSYSGSRCRLAVGATDDGGARFAAPVLVTTANCANTTPVTALTFDRFGDGFLYGPRLFVTHDGGRIWAASRQPGQVLAVAAVNRSIWMLQADCRRVNASEGCRLRLLKSADGGRTWRPARSEPRAFAAGYGGRTQQGAAQGQSWLVRTGASSGYVASLLAEPPASAGIAGLWFTSDGGLSWSRRPTPCTGFAAALSVAPDGVLFAACGGDPGAGQQGMTVERSANGGRSWKAEASCGIGACPYPLGNGYLGSIDAVSASTLYLVGNRSGLLMSGDGGARWRLVGAVTAGSDAGTSQVIFLNRFDGLVVGVDNAPPYPEQPSIWRTSDAGRRWTAVHPVIG